MGACVDYQLKGSIAVIPMDDGKANAMSLEMETALNQVLDRVVSENTLMEEAQAKAVEYSKLNMAAYRETKNRVRQNMLAGLRAAIESDRASFREIFQV